MKKVTGFYPCVDVDTAGRGAVGQAGGVLLTQTIAATGIGRELSGALAPWRRSNAVHDPAKVVLDLAIALALGGDCLADIALLRAEPALYGPVASDATVSRTIAALAADAPVACHEFGTAGRAFLPVTRDHLGCQSWDHCARLAGGPVVRSFDRHVRFVDVEVDGDGIPGGQRG